MKEPSWMPNQYFAALTNMRSVGVMGDFRTYDYAVALRAVKTIDFMTAESAEIPYAVLNKVMNRITKKYKNAMIMQFQTPKAAKPRGYGLCSPASTIQTRSVPVAYWSDHRILYSPHAPH